MGAIWFCLVFCVVFGLGRFCVVVFVVCLGLLPGRPHLLHWDAQDYPLFPAGRHGRPNVVYPKFVKES